MHILIDLVFGSGLGWGFGLGWGNMRPHLRLGFWLPGFRFGRFGFGLVVLGVG